MNNLSFKIEPSLESNDHQVRILIDGIDWLGKDYLGIDPPEFFEQKLLFENGKLLIGRCSCGCVGCDDVLVDVHSKNDVVVWKTDRDAELSFDKKSYLMFVEETSNDFSWEDLNRNVERLVAKIFNQTIVDNDHSFDWASTRIQPKIIKLSFSKSGNQKLYQFDWDGKTVENAIENAQSFYKKLFGKK